MKNVKQASARSKPSNLVDASRLESVEKLSQEVTVLEHARSDQINNSEFLDVEEKPFKSSSDEEGSGKTTLFDSDPWTSFLEELDTDLDYGDYF